MSEFTNVLIILAHYSNHFTSQILDELSRNSVNDIFGVFCWISSILFFIFPFVGRCIHIADHTQCHRESVSGIHQRQFQLQGAVFGCGIVYQISSSV